MIENPIRGSLVAVFLALSACSADSDRPLDAGPPPIEAWSAVEELRIGTVDGGGPDQFGQVAGLLMDDDERIYVLDFQAQEIQVFDQAGVHLRTIGAPGDGPGELRRGSGMNLSPSGDVVVWDPGAPRFTTFSPEGDVLSTVPRLTRGVAYPWRGGFTPDGRFIDWGLEYPEMEPGTNQPGSTLHYHAIEVDLSDGAVDTLHTFVGSRESSAQGTPPFSRSSSIHQSRSGDVWVSDPASYTVTRYSSTGDSLATIALPGEPAPVTEAELDSIRASLAQSPGRSVDWSAIPGTKQVVRRMFDDGRNHLFVMPQLTDVPLGTAADVIDAASNRHIARLTFPEPLHYPYPPPIGFHDRILAVVTDDLGVEYVVRYRIQKEGR